MAGQQRVLVTQDRDFGELVYCRGGRCAGVIYLRLRTRSAPDLLRAFQIAWPRIQTQVVGHFITVSAAKVRIRVLPPCEGAG
jgi:predicted nuclease of predicted toxin-antitoxin system